MNQLEQTPFEYKKSIENLENKARRMFLYNIVFCLVIAILFVFCFSQNNVINYQQDRIENLILATDSYKNLLLTPNK